LGKVVADYDVDAQAIGELPETNEGAAGSGGDMEQTVQTEPVSGDGGKKPPVEGEEPRRDRIDASRNHR
jgi:hypothetical protein